MGEINYIAPREYQILYNIFSNLNNDTMLELIKGQVIINAMLNPKDRGELRQTFVDMVIQPRFTYAPVGPLNTWAYQYTDETKFMTYGDIYKYFKYVA